MSERKYDKVLQVDIGRTIDDFASITNIVHFAEKVISPDGDLVDPLSMINGWNPAGIHQNHKYWELTLQLDTNWYIDDANKDQYWEYYQNVNAADDAPSIDENGPNIDIEWFVVHVRNHDGTYTKFTFSTVVDRAGAYTSATLVIDDGTGRGTILADGATPFGLFTAGERIELKNCEDAANDGIYTIHTVTDTLITLTVPLTAANADDTTITIHTTNVLWCVGKTSEFNNETGTRHQTVTFKFICLRERTRAADVVPTATIGQGAGKIKRIANVREGGEDCVNVLSFKEDFVMMMTPQFVPNTYPGVGLKQDEKYRVITVVLDSEDDIYDNMISVVGAQGIAVTDFEADFVMDDANGTVETWAYTPVASVYMMRREEGRINEAKGRETIQSVFICYGSKSVAQA